jgi:hypothetical protein
LRSLMSCGPIPLVKVRPPEALVVPPFFGGIRRGDQSGRPTVFKTKREEPEGRRPLAGPSMLAQPGGPAALAQPHQASWAR